MSLGLKSQPNALSNTPKRTSHSYKFKFSTCLQTLLLQLTGEWVTEWQVKGATKEDYQKFAKAELEVFGRASFGWAYWALKNVNKHWSLEWMIKNGYIKL